MLVEADSAYPQERAFGWRRLGAVRVNIAAHPILSGLTFRYVDDSESCPDAVVRDSRDHTYVLRDLLNDGLDGIVEIYCFVEPSGEADVTWRNWGDQGRA